MEIHRTYYGRIAIIAERTILDPLPRILQARFAARFGGSQVEIPKQPRGRVFARLADAVGDYGAQWVCKKLGPGKFYIPREWPWQVAQRADDARTACAFGLPVIEIAAMYGVSVRTVENWIKS